MSEMRPPPDDWSPELWKALGPQFGEEIPPEAIHELDPRYLRFYAWLVVTGRLAGDTPPRPVVPIYPLGGWD